METLCWSCCRSAAPKEISCIRDKTFGTKNPDGVKIVSAEHIASAKKIAIRYFIVECPEYMSMNDPENLKLLSEARKRNNSSVRDEMMDVRFKI